MSDCKIEARTKLRNGTPNWWCYTHFCGARGLGAEPLSECLKSNLEPVKETEKLYLDIEEWDSVGIWGALEPIFDSRSKSIYEIGVHIHTRKSSFSKKIIDETYKEVYVKLRKDDLLKENWLKIDQEIASAYTSSVVFNKKLDLIFCKHCGKPHIDADWFSVNIHKKHFCTFCGRDFFQKEPNIGNPIVELQINFEEYQASRTLAKVEKSLNIKTEDYKGGIQIWGSNPAILWKSEKTEEEGIHIHAFREGQEYPAIDDTFSEVLINGISLDDKMIRYYMVQKSLNYLKDKVLSINCPKCSTPHFDQDDWAITPHQEHSCSNCGHKFRAKSKLSYTIGNPIVGILKLI